MEGFTVRYERAMTEGDENFFAFCGSLPVEGDRDTISFVPEGREEGSLFAYDIPPQKM